MNYIYKITNLINNKIYIGVHKTNNVDDNYMGSGKHLKYAQKKYGIENFKKEILEYFDTYNDALDKERLIVNEEFILRKDTYNIRIGGRGGNISKDDVIRGAIAGGQSYKEKVKSLSGPDLDRYKERMSEQSALGVSAFNKKYEENNGVWWKNGFKDKTHTDESLSKMRGKRPHASGEASSQFGKCWVTKDNINRKIKKDDLDSYLSDGWIKGRILK